MIQSPEQQFKRILKRKVYSPYDISLALQVEEPKVEEWIDSGELPSFKIPGNHSRISWESLNRFLESKKIERFSWADLIDKFRVLVVEDDSDMLEIIGELLLDIPEAEAQMEASGFGAALKIVNWHPDVILLDFVMPGMDGFEVCRQLKKNPKTKDIPIIAITSLSTSENRNAVKESGISVFLGKPFQADSMLQMVREMLGLNYLEKK